MVGNFTLFVVLILCLWSLCLDICWRTVKLSFFSCGFNGVRHTTAENTHCWGVKTGSLPVIACQHIKTGNVYSPLRLRIAYTLTS